MLSISNGFISGHLMSTKLTTNYNSIVGHLSFILQNLLSVVFIVRYLFLETHALGNDKVSLTKQLQSEIENGRGCSSTSKGGCTSQA